MAAVSQRATHATGRLPSGRCATGRSETAGWFRSMTMRLRDPRRIGAYLAACLLALTPGAYADTLAERIHGHIAKPSFAAASWGIAVVSLDDGRTVYEHDAGTLLLPASTAKLFTASFALDRLGPDYRTHTDVLAAGEVTGRGRLRGPLVLRGRGDPTLAGTDWAERLAGDVHNRGIRRIDGGIVGDDTAFAGPPIGSGWEASDLQFDYGADAGALTVDENTMVVTPGAEGVAIAPSEAGVTVAAQPASAWQVYRAPGSSTVHVLDGGAATAPKRLRLSLPDPALAAARRLQAALERQGIRVDGEARSVHWPVPAPSGEVVASLPSPPLVDILRSGLKRSQNLYLQSVFLLTGLEAHEPPATGAEDSAASALRTWLGQRGIGPSATTLEEGTGLSRHDLTTAGSLVRLLSLMDASPRSAEWRALLPVAGVDGTLARRMRDTAASGNLQAKTGSMSFVNALAGYVTTKGGQRLAFAILLNNYRPPAQGDAPSPSAAVDAIATALAESTERL